MPSFTAMDSIPQPCATSRELVTISSRSPGISFGGPGLSFGTVTNRVFAPSGPRSCRNCFSNAPDGPIGSITRQHGCCRSHTPSRNSSSHPVPGRCSISSPCGSPSARHPARPTAALAPSGDTANAKASGDPTRGVDFRSAHLNQSTADSGDWAPSTRSCHPIRSRGNWSTGSAFRSAAM